MKTLMSAFKIGIFLCIIGSGAARAFSYVWDNERDARLIEKALLEKPIVLNKGLKDHFLEQKKQAQANWSTNSIKFITLEGGLSAVFKKGEYAYAEVAAYRISQLMKVGLVPPTVFRAIDGQLGSLQLFIPSLGTLGRYKKKLSLKAISDMQVFYFLSGQWDIHEGNQLIYERGGKLHLALIDNAGILHRQQVRYGEFPFVEKGEDKSTRRAPDDPEEFPFSQASRIRFTNYSAFRALMRPFINDDHIDILWKKKNRVPYVIWRNSLWMQIYKNSSSSPVFTSVYYESTLKAARQLTYEHLRSIWQEGHLQDPSYYDDLIDLMLKRRDQLLYIAQSTGTIRQDGEA